MLGTIVNVLEAYFLLDAPRILQAGFLPPPDSFILILSHQVTAVELLRAFNTAMKEAVSANLKHMIGALGLLTQIAPPALWGEALHTSGVFASVWETLEEDKVMLLQ